MKTGRVYPPTRVLHPHDHMFLLTNVFSVILREPDSQPNAAKKLKSDVSSFFFFFFFSLARYVLYKKKVRGK